MLTKCLTAISSPRSSLFTMGWASNASVTARVTKGMYVRPKPSRALNASLVRSRRRATFSMLTSTAFHARAEISSEAFMCWAIVRRMCVTGTISSPPPTAAGAGCATPGAAAGAGAGAGWGGWGNGAGRGGGWHGWGGLGTRRSRRGGLDRLGGRGRGSRWGARHRCRRPLRGHEPQHVVLRDPPPGARSRDLPQVDAVLARQLPNERRQDPRPRPTIRQRL